MSICRLPRGRGIRVDDRGHDPAVLLIGFCQTPGQTELCPSKRCQARPRLHHHLEDMMKQIGPLAILNRWREPTNRGIAVGKSRPNLVLSLKEV